MQGKQQQKGMGQQKGVVKRVPKGSGVSIAELMQEEVETWQAQSEVGGAAGGRKKQPAVALRGTYGRSGPLAGQIRGSAVGRELRGTWREPGGPREADAQGSLTLRISDDGLRQRLTHCPARHCHQYPSAH